MVNSLHEEYLFGQKGKAQCKQQADEIRDNKTWGAE